LKFERIRDRDQIERFLRRDTPTHIYPLADLDPFFWSGTSWFAAIEQDQLRAICLVLDKLSIPIVYSLAPAQCTASTELVQRIRERLPARFFANLSPHLVSLFEPEDHTIEREGIFHKMVLTQFRAPAATDARIDRLNLHELDELCSFYAHNAYAAGETDQRFLEAYMLEMGPYFGIREGGSLVCAGGVHLVSERYRVAALGNIATHPDHRGRGLGRAITAAICSELRDRVDSIGLNVMASNSAAIRCYTSLGFTRCATYFEGIITRKSPHAL
jgi:ribosomal protein S18 acetylase RimI-like enzyme